MEFTIERQNSYTIIGLNGRLDTSNYVQFEDKLLQEVSEGTAVILDCQKLEYISSSGLRVLLLALKKAGQVHSKLALCSLQAPILEVFRISAFDSIFSIFLNRKEAMDSFENKQA